jgi:hypothetical protein
MKLCWQKLLTTVLENILPLDDSKSIIEQIC